MASTGVRVRVGISSTKILAKMATDNFAKKNESGIFMLTADRIESYLWPLPIEKMFMVAGRMASHFQRMGLHTIGDIARLPLGELKRRMKHRMGRQSDIMAEYYWQTANGIDPSPVVPDTRGEQKIVGHGMTLPTDYGRLEDIEVVLLELSEEVCRRCRLQGRMGRTVFVGCQGADFDRPTGFHRQTTLTEPSNITAEVAKAASELFVKHWNGLPVRKLSVALGQLTDDSVRQLTLFEDREKQRRLEKASDEIKNRFGAASIMRASSLLKSGQARDRAAKIGGHYK
jgi:DNA polymerase-4